MFRVDSYLNDKRRARLMRQMSCRIKRAPSVISNNCTAGIIFNDLGLQHVSPTVDSMFSESAFLRFCNDLEYYCDLPLTLVREDPAEGVFAKLGDIDIQFMHDGRFEEAQKKWERRVARIDFSNIAILCYNPQISEEGRRKFAELPFTKKCLFLVDESDPGLWEFSIQSDARFFEKEMALFEHMPHSLLRYYYQLDIPEWLNSGTIRRLEIAPRKSRKFEF